ncbi:hypothetical protein [Streptomyces tendae]
MRAAPAPQRLRRYAASGGYRAASAVVGDLIMSDLDAAVAE